MNRIALESLQWCTPYEKLSGNTPDISIIYRFKFYDKIYFKRNKSLGGKRFPSISNEALGRFVGCLEDVGHHMTYIIIINEETNKTLFRSRIKLTTLDPNQCIDDNQHPEVDINIPNHSTINTTPTDDNSNDDSDNDAPSPNDTETYPLTSTNNLNEASNTTASESTQMATIDVEDLIRRTYLTQPSQDGTRKRLKIVEQLDNQERTINSTPAMIRFRAINDDNTVEEIIAYNQVIDRLENSDGDANKWRFKAIIDHEGPLNQNHDLYKGSA